MIVSDQKRIFTVFRNHVYTVRFQTIGVMYFTSDLKPVVKKNSACNTIQLIKLSDITDVRNYLRFRVFILKCFVLKNDTSNLQNPFHCDVFIKA